MLKGNVGHVLFSRMIEGEDLFETIGKRMKENNVKAGVFFAIGMVKQAVLGYLKDSQYKSTTFAGPLEIASCMGNAALDENGETVIHAHMVVSNEKGEAFGGHLMKGCPVGVTAELVIIEASGVNLLRMFDEKTKLKLWKLT